MDLAAPFIQLRRANLPVQEYSRLFCILAKYTEFSNSTLKSMYQIGFISHQWKELPATGDYMWEEYVALVLETFTSADPPQSVPIPVSESAMPESAPCHIPIKFEFAPLHVPVKFESALCYFLVKSESVPHHVPVKFESAPHHVPVKCELVPRHVITLPSVTPCLKPFSAIVSKLNYPPLMSVHRVTKTLPHSLSVLLPATTNEPMPAPARAAEPEIYIMAAEPEFHVIAAEPEFLVMAAEPEFLVMATEPEPAPCHVTAMF
ncbi:uncharacterized protein LOC127416257 [Myxocyprinus asiaticus]|uniref:uncharacterized protein LOC127416257 n=1 Tax=Myxocyprinus asiaticus TaxID=70543 RepID=UPI0022226C38|nr:uncharacterized protein LOC127416257 [Myxocyprinus asiaticus]XP_051511469.1 uncharacterized protein LOC127416257 [Myxocyprinus asiaticus]